MGLDTVLENFVEGRWNFERTRRDGCPPWGIKGGKPAGTGDYLLRLPQENEFHSVEGAHRPVPAHAEVIVRTGGGGGWGDPLARDPERVRTDVLEELVSPEAARRDYGVVLTKELALDAAATQTLRASRKKGGGARR